MSASILVLTILQATGLRWELGRGEGGEGREWEGGVGGLEAPL